MSRKNMMHVISGSALSLTSVALAGSPDFDRAYAAELRADTAAHTSLLQGAGSGHDGAFHIGDGSGNNRMNIGGLMQFRYIVNNRDSEDLSGDEDTGIGFESHRVQLNFSGNVISPNWEYRIGLDFGSANNGFDTASANGDSDSVIRESWIRYNMEGDSNGTSLTFGQFVNPVMREDAASDATGLAVERSVVNEFFSGGYVQGVSVSHQADQFAISGTFHDGMGWQGADESGSGGTEWGDEDFDYGFGVRFDYKIEGDWAQFDDATSFKGSNNAFRIGGGINFQSGGSTGDEGGFTTSDTDYTLWTVDAQYEGNGWNVSASITGNELDEESGDEYSNLGWLAQGGYFLQDDLELFGRYEMLDIDEDYAGPEDTQSWITAGVNYYLTPESHAAKLTVDCVWALDDATGYSDGPGFGDTGLAGGSDEEFVIRGQLQLVF